MRSAEIKELQNIGEGQLHIGPRKHWKTVYNNEKECAFEYSKALCVPSADFCDKVANQVVCTLALSNMSLGVSTFREGIGTK